MADGVSGVHVEPPCLGFNRCTVLKAHDHGPSCVISCYECHGVCHDECPANIDAKEKNG